MRVTAVIKGKTALFYEQLAATPNKLAFLQGYGKNMGITIRVGNGSPRDAAEFNTDYRYRQYKTYTLEPRKGYMLATFEF